MVMCRKDVLEVQSQKHLDYLKKGLFFPQNETIKEI
jgi:hypothetical protein